MANISEILKGIFIFIFANIFFYMAWWIFSALLDWSVGESIYIGAMAWVSFIIVWITTSFIFPIYAVIKGSQDNGETNIWEIGKGVTYWFLGTIFAVIVYYVAMFFLDAVYALPDPGSGMQSNIQIIGWLGILLVYCIYIVILPGSCFYAGFVGKSKGKEEPING